ncbi:hypothetical protein B0T25DRAFT_544230 [Lasiosphaeria hispida]|uniref:Secreted protein n=1 Tax=Lasiosphaeria hispida TaxID=260671 RepID=A0AAJ0HJ38_9PEZI|nr:hypothetical protein B0T25DRAFT_544230 [Lasiosphaeria hispida]
MPHSRVSTALRLIWSLLALCCPDLLDSESFLPFDGSYRFAGEGAGGVLGPAAPATSNPLPISISSSIFDNVYTGFYWLCIARTKTRCRTME